MVCDAFIGDLRPNLVLVEVSDEEGEREGSGGERVGKDCVSHLIQGPHL